MAELAKAADGSASARLWTGVLRDLGALLREEAAARPHKWAWRQLPRGAVVACRIHPDYRVLQFRIARETKPTLRGRTLWANELKVFGRHLGIEGWQMTEADSEAGGIEALFLAPEDTRWR